MNACLRLALLCASIASSAVIGADRTACALGSDDRLVVPGEFIINFVPTDDEGQKERIRAALFSATQDDRSFSVYPASGLILLRLRGAKNVRDTRLQLAIRSVRTVVQFRSAQPNFRWRGADDLAAVPTVSNDWALRNIRADIARTRSDGNADIVVAVIDSGIDIEHEDFRDILDVDTRLWVNHGELEDGADNDSNDIPDDVRGASFHAGVAAGDVHDGAGHGTMVAGIIGGRSGNGRPGGVAQRLKLMAVRVLDKKNRGSSIDVALGINYAIQQRAHILNLSLQSDCDGDDAMRLSILRAQGFGSLVVAAAGNGSGVGYDVDMTPSYPAAWGRSDLIAVGGTNENDDIVVTSLYGVQSVDLGAPGIDMAGPWPGNRANTKSGTSFAAPLVSGGAVLLSRLTPNWSWTERGEYLVASARQSNPKLANYFASAGVLDLDQATSAPVTIQSPASEDTWRQGKTERVEWTTRSRFGACRSLDLWFSANGAPPFTTLLTAGIPTDAGSVKLEFPALPSEIPPNQVSGMLRLTCSGTELHAFSSVFSIE